MGDAIGCAIVQKVMLHLYTLECLCEFDLLNMGADVNSYQVVVPSLFYIDSTLLLTVLPHWGFGCELATPNI